MPRLRTLPEPDRREPLVDTEWSRDWGCWVVSSTYRGHWTLVGLFGSSAPAFRAARRAASSFSGAEQQDTQGC